MATNKLPSITTLRQLLDYNPDTGAFVWRKKLPEMVEAIRPSTQHRIAKNWNARFSGKPAFINVSVRGYYTGSIGCVRCYAHRVAWAMHYGEWPDGEIDHINGDRLDNRMCNLRVASRAEQMRNLCIQERNATGVIGVWWDDERKKYQAYIKVNGRRVHLGRFDNLDNAKQARATAEARFGYHLNHGRQKVQSAKM